MYDSSRTIKVLQTGIRLIICEQNKFIYNINKYIFSNTAPQSNNLILLFLVENTFSGTEISHPEFISFGPDPEGK